MTSRRRRPTDRQAAARQSVDLTRQAIREVEENDPGDVELDPASALFFEFAGPLLLATRTEHEFQSASAIAAFVWTATFLDAVTQAELLEEFIEETEFPEDMIPWLLEVYDELALRKQALVG